MPKNQDAPLRGDDAYLAAKREIAERNEKAYARGRAERALRTEAAHEQRRLADRREAVDLPVQPS